MIECKEPKIKVGKCNHLGIKVLKLYEGNGKWLCLHNENPAMDKIDVKQFIKKQRNKTASCGTLSPCQHR